MTYTFRCDGCSTEVDVERPIAHAGDEYRCLNCTASMRRVFNSYSVCDEIRSTNYLHPTLNRHVKGHGKYYDRGMGAWIHSKSERKALIKERGLTETGSTLV